jgi:hypothetical protein
LALLNLALLNWSASLHAALHIRTTQGADGRATRLANDCLAARRLAGDSRSTLPGNHGRLHLRRHLRLSKLRLLGELLLGKLRLSELGLHVWLHYRPLIGMRKRLLALRRVSRAVHGPIAEAAAPLAVAGRGIADGGHQHGAGGSEDECFANQGFGKADHVRDSFDLICFVW